jgi:hypothetical protein
MTVQGSVTRVRAPSVPLPTSVFVGLALALLALGATWWHGTEPSPSPDDPHRPVGSVIVLRLDDGRLLTYESGRTVITEDTCVPHLRGVGREAMVGC